MRDDLPSAAAEPVPPERCPLCGGTNECALAADPAAAECWCFTAAISRETLASVPEEARGRACICPRCASA